MRILAIRGENIASLERFELDFCREPLASAGIFAIVGPTGSGKSSLLDAMCLALYHKAPRMEGVSGQEAKLGGLFGEIGQNDIRNLIRRGSSTGFAETDFVGTDGNSYRAHWGYRAGKKKGAASQEDVTLLQLPDEKVLANTKSVCQDKIMGLTGLSFEKFTRTVLLAQGRFAEFLRANERDRADLLEKLTGTEIYSRISRAAYERKVREESIRRDLESALQGVQRLEPQARNAREAELAQLEEVLPLVREMRDMARTFSDQAGAWIREQARRVQIQSALTFLDARRVGLAEKRDAAQAVLQATMARINVRMEEIRKAEILDAQLVAAQSAESEKRAALHAASQTLDVLEKERAEISHRRDSHTGNLTEIDTFLESNRRLEPVSADWQQCRTLLDICATALAELRAQEAEKESAKRDVARLKPQQERLETRICELEVSLDGHGSEDLLTEAQGVERDIGDLDIYRTWLELDAREEETRSKLAQSESILAKDSAAMAATEESLRLARILLDATRDAASESAEGMRQNLVDGEPCPVCGSSHHPNGASDSGRLKALLTVHLSLVSDQELNLDGLRSSSSRAQATVELAKTELQRIRTGRERAGEPPQFVGNPPPDEISARRSWMELRKASLLERRTSIQKEQRNLGALSLARVDLSGIRSDLEKAEARDRNAEVLAQKASADLATRSTELNAKFGGETWRARWEADPKAYVAGIERRVVEYRGKSDLRIETAKAIEAESIRLEEIAKNLAAKSNEVESSAVILNTARTALQGLRQERASLLDGSDVATAQKEAQTKLQAVEGSVEASRNELDTCLQEVESRKGALGQVDRTLGEIRELLVKTGPELSESAGRPWCGLDADPKSLEEFSLKAVESCQSRAGNAETGAMRLRAELESDDRNRQSSDGYLERIKEQSLVVGRWAALSGSVGSSDGKVFRVVAQRFTLEVLLEEANRELSRIAPRYRLRILGDSMHFGVLDRDAFDEIRPVHTLSGGESFMVSLALALGLSHLAGGDLRIESLFIDEGFGTLDPSTLRSVMGALSCLHSQGRKVGVITHVEEMKGQIDVQIEVVRTGPGKSEVRVLG